MRRGPICRRHPPVIARYAERFPNIMSDDWCGEFERIKTSEEKKECVQGQTVLSKCGLKENALKSIEGVLLLNTRDWAEDQSTSWIYGIVCGWNEAALAELSEKWNWSKAEVDRLRRLHKRYKRLKMSGL